MTPKRLAHVVLDVGFALWCPEDAVMFGGPTPKTARLAALEAVIYIGTWN